MTRAVGHTSGPAASEKVVDRHSRLQFPTILDMTYNEEDNVIHLVEIHSNFLLLTYA